MTGDNWRFREVCLFVNFWAREQAQSQVCQHAERAKNEINRRYRLASPSTKQMVSTNVTNANARSNKVMPRKAPILTAQGSKSVYKFHKYRWDKEFLKLVFTPYRNKIITICEKYFCSSQEITAKKISFEWEIFVHEYFPFFWKMTFRLNFIFWFW